MSTVKYSHNSNESVNKPMKNGTMVARGSIAIEPQDIPGAEKFSQYGSILLRPEETFHSETTYHIAY